MCADLARALGSLRPGWAEVVLARAAGASGEEVAAGRRLSRQRIHQIVGRRWPGWGGTTGGCGAT
jgi:hypothetical protein